MKLLILLRGWWRHLWGHCPECNDDAPECDNCIVCQGFDSRERFKWPKPCHKDMRAEHWRRFRTIYK
jgi:hypothetical protein